MRSIAGPYLPAVATLLVLAACDSRPDAPATTAETPQATAPAATAPSSADLTDAEIAAVVVEANSIDAELGELAASRARSEEVRAFGRTMATDHRAVNQQAGELVARLGVTPVESGLSRQLRADANEFRSELETKSGAEFDRAYIDHEVAYHQAVIDAVDQVLLPSAENPELRQTITDVRPALVAHLQRAQSIQATLR